MVSDQLLEEQRLVFNTYAFISVAGSLVKNVINSQIRILKQIELLIYLFQQRINIPQRGQLMHGLTQRKVLSLIKLQPEILKF